MKQQTFTRAIVLLALLFAMMKLHAQDDCTFKAPFLTIDFGAGKDIADLNFFPLQGIKGYTAHAPMMDIILTLPLPVIVLMVTG